MTDEGKTTQPSVEDLQKQLEHEREQRQKWEAKATDYDKRFTGIDPERVKADREALELLQRDQAKSDPKKFDEWATNKEKEIRASVGKEVETIKERAARLERENKELKVTDKVFSLGADVFHSAVHDDFKDYIRRYCDQDDDGNIYVKDENGKPRYMPGSTTEKMTPQGFIDWLKEKKEPWVISQNVSGGGGGERRPANGNGGDQFAHLTLDKLNTMTKDQLDKIPASVLSRFL